MRQWILSCAVAVAVAASPGGASHARAADAPGTGAGYEAIGKVPVMHEGRVKPLDTVAREEVKQVYGRETIKLADKTRGIELMVDPRVKPGDRDTPVKWGHVSVFLGWFMCPEFWDDQSFILVDYLPLRRMILAETLMTRLKAVAAKPTTSQADRESLESLAAAVEPSHTALAGFLGRSSLPLEDKKTVAELALKLSESDHWMSPRELNEARVIVHDQPRPFLDWASDLQDQQRRYNANPTSAPRLSEVERRAVEVGNRLMTYKAYSSDRLQSNGLVLIMPRLTSDAYLADTAKSIKHARETRDMAQASLLVLDELKAISTYWNDIPIDDRHDPAESKDADQRYKNWLRDNVVWTPVQVFLKSKPEDLIAAGYPESQLRAFLEAYRTLESSEAGAPGHSPEMVGKSFLAAARAFGEAINPTSYPATSIINRETSFNATNPFYQAPLAYGLALVLLLFALGFASLMQASTVAGFLTRTVYRTGLTALLAGIVIEVYGFYLRVRISGWAPVTNMYETVIWVALVAAVLAFIMELIYPKVMLAIAGSGVALLGTITAANVPLLDPSIKSLQPVLRSNYWLTIHVLTEVSSYAAFAVAWMLGLIACGRYLVTTYRRSPRPIELAAPLGIGAPMLLVGAGGVAAFYGLLGPGWAVTQSGSMSSDTLFYVCAVLGLLGGSLSLAGFLAVAGELTNRMLYPEAYRTEGVSSAAGSENLRARAMQNSAASVKLLSNFVYRTMQVGVLLVAAGTILGGVWADESWGRFWGWDPKEVWALITLLVYLIPLHGRFAGWISSFALVVSSVVCFLSVIMAWYGVNFILGVGLHSYGFVEAGYQGAMSMIIAGVMALPIAAAWRRSLGQRALERLQTAEKDTRSRPSPHALASS